VARPGIEDIRTEERLSLATGDLSGAIEAIGAAAAYVRMMLRREPRLMEFAQAADQQMAGAVDAIDRARGRIQIELATAQAIRIVKNRKDDDANNGD